MASKYAKGYIRTVSAPFTSLRGLRVGSDEPWTDEDRGMIDAKLDLLDDLWNGRLKSNMVIQPQSDLSFLYR